MNNAPQPPPPQDKPEAQAVEANARLSQHLTERGAKQSPTLAFENHARAWFGKNRPRIAALVGNQDQANKLMIAFLNAVNKTPTLMECGWEGLVQCLMTSAEYGVMPGAFHECAYVPFRNKGRTEAVFILQYQGLCKLLYSSGFVTKIAADVVRENDSFMHKRGTGERIEHDYASGDRGPRVGVWVVITNKYGAEHCHSMTAEEIDQFKARSPAARSSDSPWNSKYDSDVDWMWKKTCLKQSGKLLPLTYVNQVADDEEPTGANGNAVVDVNRILT